MSKEREMALALREEQKNKLNSIYSIMTEEIELPSKGLFYKSKAKSVVIKPMTAQEEDILSNEKLIKSGQAFDQLIKSCIVEWNGIEFDELLIGDKNTIQIAIRVISLGDSYDNIEIVCPHCESKATRNISLKGDLSLKYITGNPIEPFKNLFSWKSPMGIEFQYRLLTNEDQKNIALENKRKKALLKDNYVQSAVTDFLSHSIMKIQDITDRMEIIELLSKMPSTELRALIKEIKTIGPDYDMTYNFICSNCEEENKINIPMTVEFFWPTGRSNTK